MLSNSGYDFSSKLKQPVQGCLSGKRIDRREYLIGKSDTKTEENPADDQHGDVASKGVKQSSGAEEKTSEEHGKSPPQFPGNIRRNQGGKQRSQVQ